MLAFGRLREKRNVGSGPTASAREDIFLYVMSLDLIMLFVQVKGSLISLVSEHITTLLCLVTQVCGLVAYVPFFDNAISFCILAQQQSLFSLYHALSTERLS